MSDLMFVGYLGEVNLDCLMDEIYEFLLIKNFISPHGIAHGNIGSIWICTFGNRSLRATTCQKKNVWLLGRCGM